MKQLLAVVVMLGAGPRLAAADDVAARSTAIKAMIDAQAKALVADDRAAFEKTLAPDAYSDVQSDLTEPSKIVVGQTKIGWAGSCGWVSAEVQFTNKPHPEIGGHPPPRMRHWVALVVADGSAVKTKAMRVLVTTPDNDLANGIFNYVSELPTEPSPSPLVAWLAQPVAVAKQLSADPATTVFGTSASDHGFGPAAAKQLLASWSKLKLDVVAPESDTDSYDHKEVVAGDCAASYGKIRMKVATGAILLEAFAVEHKVGDRWELVAFEYGPDRAY